MEGEVPPTPTPTPHPPPHPAAPRTQEESTHRRRLQAGSCWLQERERQRWVSGGGCGGDRGGGGGCPLGQSRSLGPWVFRLWAQGFLGAEQTGRGRWGLGPPLPPRLLMGLGFGGWLGGGQGSHRGPIRLAWKQLHVASRQADDPQPHASRHSFFLSFSPWCLRGPSGPGLVQRCGANRAAPVPAVGAHRLRRDTDLKPPGNKRSHRSRGERGPGTVCVGRT